MARNPKVTVDVEFGKVDQREIDKIVNDVSGKLKNMELDPGWAEKFEQARRKVSEIRKEVEDARKESEKIAKKKKVFPNFKGSIYDATGMPKVRNATLTTIAFSPPS